MYRNAEPHSLRDLFFYFKSEQKHRKNLENQIESLKYKKIINNNYETKNNCEIFTNKIDTLQECLIDENLLSSPKFHPFIRSCLLLLISRIFRIGILFPVKIYYNNKKKIQKLI